MLLKKKIEKVAVVFFVMSLMTSCNKIKNVSLPQQAETSNKDMIRIGFSIDTLALERWQRDLDVFMNKARELGAEVIVQNAGNSIETQQSQLEYMIQRKVNAVVIVPKDRNSLSESVKELREKNISVISYDRLISEADVNLYLSVNTERVGELMAEQFLKERIGNKWNLILGPDEDYNMTLMQEGIEKVIKGRGVYIKDIFYTDSWNYDLSYTAAVNLLTSGNIPDAIICGNDAVAGSVLNAIDDYYPGHHIPICGQDADIAACQAIVRGRQDFTVYKPITELAEKAAECAVRLAAGDSVSDILEADTTINNGYGDIPVIWLEPKVVTKENIDTVVVKSGFHTSGEVYK